MATTQTLFELIISIFFILISILTSQVVSVVPEQCSLESSDCVDKSKALPLKIIAIASILVTSMIGVSSPLLTRSIPVLGPDRSLFVIVKAFAAGIILATGFMHVLPDSFDMLSSSCLPEKPWHKFPFSGFVAMFSAIGTLMVDSIATSLYSQRNRGGGGVIPENSEVVVEGGDEEEEVGGGHHGAAVKEGSQGTQLLRYRVVAMQRKISFNSMKLKLHPLPGRLQASTPTADDTTPTDHHPLLKTQHPLPPHPHNISHQVTKQMKEDHPSNSYTKWSARVTTGQNRTTPQTLNQNAPLKLQLAKSARMKHLND
ncbi:hypothetical protein HYC85_027089 [Camellia sinensis]|uniref:Uncharacterized protein n=1 Tax=Camellia sinensis TaxID=4442 RepID=A0A7J7G5F5_CAMSI|nr:hypothetical protein HYC85_027089 [Camellia sinensis]